MFSKMSIGRRNQAATAPTCERTPDVSGLCKMTAKNDDGYLFARSHVGPLPSDLPKSTISGLKHSIEVLKDVKSIKFTKFGAKDVIRHSLVQEIVQAYDNFE